MRVIFTCEVCTKKFEMSAADADSEMHICCCCGTTVCPSCFTAAEAGDHSRDCCLLGDDTVTSLAHEDGLCEEATWKEEEAFIIMIERERDDRRWARMEEE